jgi:hypothetical protein
VVAVNADLEDIVGRVELDYAQTVDALRAFDGHAACVSFGGCAGARGWLRFDGWLKFDGAGDADPAKFRVSPTPGDRDAYPWINASFVVQRADRGSVVRSVDGDALGVVVHRKGAEDWTIMATPGVADSEGAEVAGGR